MANDLSPSIEMMPCDLTRFFEGRSEAWGIFEDRFGAVKRRFRIALEGRWSGTRFELFEHVRVADGEEERRLWVIEPDSSGQGFVGRCDDALSDAIGTISPGLATMTYEFRLKLKGRTIDLTFHDRFIPVDGGGLLNRTRVSKWGVKVGEVTAFFRRTGDDSSDLERLAA